MAVNLAQAPSSSQRASQNASALKQVFEALHVNSCPHFFNFHMHTVCSDGKLEPAAAIAQALEIGLQGLAITDHHTVDGYCIAQRWLEERQPSRLTERTENCLPRLWTGVEITSELLKTEVHILGYAFNPDCQAIQPYLQGERPRGNLALATQVIAAIHQAGGLAVLAHPERYRRSAAELIPEATRLGIDGVEAYYAYGNPNPWQPSSKQTRQVLQLSQHYRLFNTCGTDTHGMNLLQRL